MNVYPHYNDDSDNRSYIQWFGEEEANPKFCSHCHTVILRKRGRFMWCRECNYSFPIAEQPEVIKIDSQVSAFGSDPPSIVCQPRSTVDRIVADNEREELEKRFGKNNMTRADDLSILKRPGVKILREWDQGL